MGGVRKSTEPGCCLSAEGQARIELVRNGFYMLFTKSVAVFLAATSMFAVAVANETNAVSSTTAIESAAAPDEAGQPAENASAASTDENEQAAEKVAQKEDTKICKYIATAGSRLGRKVCMTKDEWDQIRKDSQEGVNNLQRQNTATGRPQG